MKSEHRNHVLQNAHAQVRGQDKDEARVQCEVEEEGTGDAGLPRTNRALPAAAHTTTTSKGESSPRDESIPLRRQTQVLRGASLI